MKNIGLQLYTLRNILSDHEKTSECLANVKKIGYDEVQLYGDFAEMERLGKISKERGLKVIGSTMGFDLMLQNPEETMELHDRLETNHIGIGIYRYKDENDVKDFIAKANSLAKIFNKNGFMLSYHNHSHEFVKYNGEKTVFDTLIDELDESISFVADTYWIQHGGADIRYTMEKLNGRIDILHLKDMKRILTPEKHTFCEIGKGNLYWDGIIETAKKIGVKHYVVEQDTCEADPMESILISSKYLHENYMER